MTDGAPQQDGSTAPAQRRGILLVNLGTPDAPTPVALRRYLVEFLSDPRVVPLPRLLWRPLLRMVIAPLRARKSAELYGAIWTDAGSPLAVHSAALAQAVQQAVQQTLGDGVIVRHAMRYGAPQIADMLREMQAAGAATIHILPLYPQQCIATTTSAADAIDDALRKMAHPPKVDVAASYATHPAYVGALARSVRQYLDHSAIAPQRILASFHGMPERSRAAGDPYYDQCHASVAALSAALGRTVDIGFQSRFGRARWLEPASEALLCQWAQSGVEHVAVLAPGFAADCLETLEELAIRARAAFLAAGGKSFAYIPCLNASADAVALVRALATA